MIDIHCHILPGIDDGAKTIEDSIDMAQSAVENGISHIIATPHHNARSWLNPKADVISAVHQLNEALTDADVPLTVSAGQEVRISGNLIEQIDNDEIVFLDETNRYLLIEFPTPAVPRYTKNIFYQLFEREIISVIAHPERNHAIAENPDILHDLVANGALAQVTTSSYSGDLGKKIEKLSKDLIRADLIHIIASDAHNIHNRPFNMDKALKKLEKEFGRDKAKYFQSNSKRILEGKLVQTPTPEKVKKKKFFGLF